MPTEVDFFDDGDIAEYSGDTADFAAQSTTVESGTHALEYNGSGWAHIITTSGLNAFPSAGDTFRYYARFLTDSAQECFFTFGAQNTNWTGSQYGIRLDGDNETFEFEKSESGGLFNDLALASGISYTADIWYEVVVDWGSNGLIDVTLNDDTGTQVANISATDTSYTSGGIGFEANERATNSKVFWDSVQIDTAAIVVSLSSEAGVASEPAATVSAPTTAALSAEAGVAAEPPLALTAPTTAPLSAEAGVTSEPAVTLTAPATVALAAEAATAADPPTVLTAPTTVALSTEAALASEPPVTVDLDQPLVVSVSSEAGVAAEPASTVDAGAATQALSSEAGAGSEPAVGVRAPATATLGSEAAVAVQPALGVAAPTTVSFVTETGVSTGAVVGVTATPATISLSIEPGVATEPALVVTLPGFDPAELTHEIKQTLRWGETRRQTLRWAETRTQDLTL